MMTLSASNQRIQIAVLTLTLLGLGGCIEYRIETTLNGDGSGTRREEMIVDENADEGVNVSYADFGELMFVGERYRWTHVEEVRDDDTVHVFRRETEIGDLASWAELSDDVRIAGALETSADSSVGRISLGDVHFRNRVKVESGRVAEYTSFTYRETFYWENLIDAVIERLLIDVGTTLDAQYPDLTPGQRGEIIGVVRGGLWGAVDRGLFDASGDEEEAIVSALVDRSAEQAVRIVRQRYPDADQAAFRGMLRQAYDDDDDRLGTFLEELLPGVQLAANSEIVFRLAMPGRVTSSNAHERDGAVLVWKFGPGDAATAPVEIFAESAVGR